MEDAWFAEANIYKRSNLPVSCQRMLDHRNFIVGNRGELLLALIAATPLVRCLDCHRDRVARALRRQFPRRDIE